MQKRNPERLIILDRDGVINRDSDSYIKTVEEWIPLEGSIDAIAKLYKAGYTICVATNQSGIARGYYTEEVLHQMHAKLEALVEKKEGKIHSIYYCPHGPDDNCDCRKPKPGMFRQIADVFGFADLSLSYSVGDSLRDLQAASELCCNTVLVESGKGRGVLSSGAALPEGTKVYKDLRAFADSLLCLR